LTASFAIFTAFQPLFFHFFWRRIISCFSYYIRYSESGPDDGQPRILAAPTIISTGLISRSLEPSYGFGFSSL